jgi:hypothetical protein
MTHTRITATDQQASPKKKTHLHDNSTDAQRVRLLARLYAGPVDTFTARSELNILMPAARVKELRELGYPIKTHRITLADDHGRPHHGVAMYYLGTLPPARQGKTGTDLFSPPPTQLIQPPSFLPGPPTSPSSAHPVPDWQPAGRRS